MAALIASRVSIASFAVAGLVLTPVVLRAQARASEPPFIVQVIVQQPAVIQQPAVVTQAVAAMTDPNLVSVRWGTNWYPATRLRTVWGPYTLIRFDGYGPEWDSIVHERDLRARGVITRCPRGRARSRPSRCRTGTSFAAEKR